MAIAFVNKVSKSGAGTSAAVNMAGANLFVLVYSDHGTPDAPGAGFVFSDSVNGTTRWVHLTNTYAYSNLSEAGIAYCWNALSSSSQTFTVGGTMQYPAWTVYGFSGAYTAADPFDIERHDSGNSYSTSLSTGSVTPAATGALCVASLTNYADATSTITINSGFSTPDNIPCVGGVNYAGAGSYKIKTDAAAENPAWGTTGADFSNGYTMIAVFKAAPQAFTLINSVTTAGTGTSAAVDMHGATLFVVAYSEGSGTNATVVDSVNGSTRWVALPRSVYTTGAGINYCWNASSNAIAGSMTFTISGGAFAYHSWTVYGFAGAYVASDPLDTERHDASGSGATMPTGSVTPSATDMLAVTSLTDDAAVETYTIDSGYSTPASIGYSFGVTYVGSSAYKIKTDAAAENPTWTSTGTFATGGAASIAVFRPLGYASADLGPPSISAETLHVVDQQPPDVIGPDLVRSVPAEGLKIQDGGAQLGFWSMYSVLHVVDYFPSPPALTSDPNLSRSVPTEGLKVQDQTPLTRENPLRALVVQETLRSFEVVSPSGLAGQVTSVKPGCVVEVELAGDGHGWTDITADVLTRGGIAVRIGIQGSGPTDLVAGAGVARVVLNNSTTNSAGILGYYSPYHSSHRAGWRVDIGFRIRLVNPNTGLSYTRFVGRIDAIDPTAGLLRDRGVTVTAVDWMDEAARFVIPPDVGEHIGETWDHVIGDIVAQMPRWPPAASYDVGMETYPYVLDTSKAQGSYALQELAKLAASEYGLIYQKANGTLRAEGRHQRLLDTTSDWTLTPNTMAELSLPSTRGELIKTIRVTTHPKIPDPLPTTLVYDQANIIEIAAGVTQTVQSPFRDPITGDPIGATAIQPQRSGTDYLAYTNRDGTGTDVTASITVVPTKSGSQVSFTIANGTGVTAYLTRNRLYGRGIYDFGTQQFEAGTGTPVVLVDMPYQVDPNVGQGAANYLLSKFSSSFAQVRTVTVKVRDEATLLQVLTRDISDRIDLTETVTGLVSSYFINGIEWTISPGGTLVATYTLAPAYDPLAALYWILGTSILGTNTIPAPF